MLVLWRRHPHPGLPPFLRPVDVWDRLRRRTDVDRAWHKRRDHDRRDAHAIDQRFPPERTEIQPAAGQYQDRPRRPAQQRHAGRDRMDARHDLLDRDGRRRATAVPVQHDVAHRFRHRPHVQSLGDGQSSENRQLVLRRLRVLQLPGWLDGHHGRNLSARRGPGSDDVRLEWRQRQLLRRRGLGQRRSGRSSLRRISGRLAVCQRGRRNRPVHQRRRNLQG